MAETITRTPEETIDLGRSFGATLVAGDVVFLNGDLGAGKTTFARGVAAACGIESGVRSPTFALMHRYRGNPDIVHIDLYRQAEGSGLDDLALEEWGPEVITLVEWPKEFAAEQWPHALKVEFRHIDEETRGIRLPGDPG